jgi:UDP-N-acetylmuramate--alanine ligase
MLVTIWNGSTIDRFSRMMGGESPSPGSAKMISTSGQESRTVFSSRAPTGEVWRGEPRSEDLILTRILTLEGLEEGVNRGPGKDSLERYIYIHGTNHPEDLGKAVSHGCVRMAGADLIRLFARVREGDPVLVAPCAEDALGLGGLHFIGVGGSGMSALAQFAAMLGGRVSGSDRSFDQGKNLEGKARLESLGIRVHPQDGSGMGARCGAVIHSTAVEAQVPDMAAARSLGTPLVHRSELLAHFVAGRRSLAITGTSGKSITAAMAFEILRRAGLDPSVITGGDLRALQEEGLWGNAWAGRSDLLVVEADESDGSLVRYRPALGVVLNLQRDHKEMDEVAAMFRTFRSRVREGLVVGEAPNLAEFAPGATVFGFGPAAQVRAVDLVEGPGGSRFRVWDQPFRVPLPGRHNVENALAAMAACHLLGVHPGAMAEALADFRGVARRFQSLGRRRGVEVVDDFAHNPAKIQAALGAARLRSRRILAVWQPHGFGPLRFLRQDLVEAFRAALGPGDRLWLPEAFYAGGTVSRDVSSADLAGDLQGCGVNAVFSPARQALVEEVAAEAREGDLVLVMGARDPSLTDLARSILESL